MADQQMNEVKSEDGKSVAGENKFSLTTPGAIVIAGLIIAAAVYFSNTGGSGGKIAENNPNVPGAVPPPAVVVNSDELYDANDAFLGNPEAKVVVVEFADFQCPFCGRFFNENESKIINTDVKTGKVKFVYKHFPFLGAESQSAAEAAECAKDQNKFWQYHDFLYKHIWDNYYAKGENGENVGVFKKENLKKFAGQTGLNQAQFNQCLDSGKYSKKVLDDMQIGRKNGANGTPTSFINGKIVVGAQPYSAFETVIEEELEKAGN